MAKILLNFPLCVSAKREKCSIRHGGQEIYRPHYWGIYQGVQQADENQQKKSCNKKILAKDGRKFSSVVSENVWGDITAANFDSRRLLASLSTFLAQDAGDLSCFGCEI